MTEEEIRAFIEKYDTKDKLQWLDEECDYCGRRLNSWDKRIANAMMIHFNSCEACIAEEYGMTVEGLRSRMQDEFGMSPCKGI